MQYLTITKDTTLSSLTNDVGERNLDTVLNANNLERTVNIGKEFNERNKKALEEAASEQVDYQTKMKILNQFVGDSDIWEKAALGTEDEWQLLNQFNCFSDAIRIPIEVKLPTSEGVLGNSEPVSDRIYNAAMDQLQQNNYIDPGLFAEYSTSASSRYFSVTSTGGTLDGNLSEWFVIPWGAVCLRSSIDLDLLYFPVYPEELDDGVTANYEDMPEMLYQYEPWKVYKSSGPREMTFTFKFHRDMWTGDHRDGNANALIRSCEANCYPKYDGSIVNVPIVTLYIEGENYITGVMTNCKKHWSGPIGLDGFYLVCELSFTIVEVSPEALNYDSVKEKGLIG